MDIHSIVRMYNPSVGFVRTNKKLKRQRLKITVRSTEMIERKTRFDRSIEERKAKQTNLMSDDKCYSNDIDPTRELTEPRSPVQMTDMRVEKYQQLTM